MVIQISNIIFKHRFVIVDKFEIDITTWQLSRFIKFVSKMAAGIKFVFVLDEKDSI